MGDKLGRQHRNGDTSGQTAEIYRAQYTGVVAGAAGDDVDIAGSLELVNQRINIGGVLHQVEQFLSDLGLFVDLFEHEVIVAALLHGFHSVFDQFWLAINRAAILHFVDLISVGPEGDDFAIFQAHDVAGNVEHRR